jgi:FkbM family methyltransferase
MKNLYGWAQRAARRCGLNVTRATNTLESKRFGILTKHDISVVLDVGANTGQYACEVRRGGYQGRIVSFEPLSAPYQILSRIAERDPRHECRQIALGNSDQIQLMHVSSNLVSSSLFEITDEAVMACPESALIGTEAVKVVRLDTIRDEILRDDDRVYLKIDTQGYEKEVLFGATNALLKAAAIEVELSLVPLYRDQPLLPELWDLLNGLGFQLVWVERGFVDPGSGFMMQVDGLFTRAHIGV